MPLLHDTSIVQRSPCAFDDADRVDRHAARLALDLDAGARVFVERLAVALERRVHRRHLLDRADESRAGALQRCAVDGDVGHGPDHLAFAVAGRRRHAELQGREVALVGVEARLRELGRRAEAQRQQAARQRVERAGVAGLLGAIEALGALQRRVARQAQRPCRAGARRARRAGRSSGARPHASSSRCSVVLGPRRVRLGDQRGQLGGALGRAVELEVQRRHGVDLQALEEAVADEAGRLVERGLALRRRRRSAPRRTPSRGRSRPSPRRRGSSPCRCADPSGRGSARRRRAGSGRRRESRGWGSMVCVAWCFLAAQTRTPPSCGGRGFGRQPGPPTAFGRLP